MLYLKIVDKKNEQFKDLLRSTALLGDLVSSFSRLAQVSRSQLGYPQPSV